MSDLEGLLDRWEKPVQLDKTKTFFLASMAVDSIECGIPKWSHSVRRAVDFSEKAKKTTWKYQVTTRLYDGKILHVTPTSHGSVDDSTLLTSSRIVDCLVYRERIVVDRDYDSTDHGVHMIIGFDGKKLTAQQAAWNG